MKNKILITVLSCCIVIGAIAQTGRASGTTHGKGEDSLRCLVNINLFIPYVNSKNFTDALPYWKAVYEECPASHRNIYIMGASIINWQIEQESDPAKKEALIDAMMTLYDDRVKYFGQRDPRDRKDIVVGRKAQAYNQLKGENSDFHLIYKWTGEAINEFKEKTDPLTVSLYMFSSFKLMQNDKENLKTQYINDFTKSSDIMDALLLEAEAAKDENRIDNITARKADFEQNFFSSGVAECPIIEEIFTPRIEDNKSNLDFLKETMVLLRRLKCTETDLFITASEYAYKIEPTAESAMGLGQKALKSKDIVTAERYFNEAIAMSTNKETKADLYYVLGTIALNQNQFAKVKQLITKCLAENPNYGRAYQLLASAYGIGGRNLYPDDPVLSKCIFYAVVEKLEKARQVDPSLAGEINPLITKYSAGFPTKEEVFMHSELEAGGTFLIGGWVNETVKIR